METSDIYPYRIYQSSEKEPMRRVTGKSEREEKKKHHHGSSHQDKLDIKPESLLFSKEVRAIHQLSDQMDAIFKELHALLSSIQTDLLILLKRSNDSPSKQASEEALANITAIKSWATLHAAVEDKKRALKSRMSDVYCELEQFEGDQKYVTLLQEAVDALEKQQQKREKQISTLCYSISALFEDWEKK